MRRFSRAKAIVLFYGENFIIFLSIISIHANNSINNLKQNKKKISTSNLYNKQKACTSNINKNRRIIIDLNCTKKN